MGSAGSVFSPQSYVLVYDRDKSKRTLDLAREYAILPPPRVYSNPVFSVWPNRNPSRNASRAQARQQRSVGKFFWRERFKRITLKHFSGYGIALAQL